MPKPDKPEDIKDESKEEKEVEVLGTLDEIHDKAVADLENEPNEEDEDEDVEDKPADDAGAADGDDVDAPAGDEEDEKPEIPPPAPEPEEPPVPQPAPAPAPAPELDTDSTKPGPTKVAVKGFDEKTYYFNNLDEVPEDFEPASYKEWGRAVQRFTDKEQTDRQAAQEAAAKADRDARETRIKEIRDGWEKDISDLVDSGVLPTDKAERDKVAKEVFALMDEELAKGRVLDFAPAFEIYEYRQDKAERETRIKQEKDDKKRRGGRIQGSGSGATPGPARNSSPGRTIEAPPQGLSLDDIHSNVLGSL